MSGINPDTPLGSIANLYSLFKNKSFNLFELLVRHNCPKNSNFLLSINVSNE